MRTLITLFLSLLLFEVPLFAAPDDGLKWPREIDTENYLITLYQPQLESFEKNELQGRIAISIEPKEGDMLFCSAWFVATMETDLEQDTALLKSIDISKVHFPDIENEEAKDQLAVFLKETIESWNLVMSLDRLSASLGDIDGLQAKSESLNNDPPAIYYRTTPTILISIDGDPILKKIDNTDLEHVANTAFFIVKEVKTKQYYLNGGDYWYQSKEIMKNWQKTTEVPPAIEKMAEKYEPPETAQLPETDDNQPPEIVVVTEPSEIIVVDGKPDYQAVEGSSLLYVMNSESDIIMNVKSQEHFVLLAGRWYRSKSLKDGDWHFVEPQDLPDEFATIPEKSSLATVRPSIPGTPEAQDALLDQIIPQTATVDRKTATVTVQYDGDPEFIKTSGSEVSYAVNSDKTVLKIKDRYYCVDQAVWFVSDQPTGPWVVSDVRPDEVDTLPPESPVYNVKYVYVYNSTPEVVHVGYYPGYCHSYVYKGTVVYGTGFWYRPWYRRHYYPRPFTWGFGVHWNPYSGWGFSAGFSYGWVGWGFHPYSRPYWGPRGYHRGYRHGYHRGYKHGYNRGFRHGARAGYQLGKRSPGRPVQFNNVNVYNNRKTGIVKTRDINRSRDLQSVRTAVRPSNRPNNLFSDRQGNVYQRTKDGNWAEKRNKAVSLPAERPNFSNTRENIQQRPNKGQNLPAQRPNIPNTRENIQQRPNKGQNLPAQRPVIPNTRENIQQRPNKGQNLPAQRPNIPNTRENIQQRPNKGQNLPAQRPNTPNTRENIQQSRPQSNVRPPQTNNRPAPSQRPEMHNRPAPERIQQTPPQREIPRQQLNRSHENRMRGEQRHRSAPAKGGGDRGRAAGRRG